MSADNEKIQTNEVIKNLDYLRAMKQYKYCINNNFKKIQFDHNKFNSFINQNADKVCGTQFNTLKEIIDNGGLDYENFIK